MEVGISWRSISVSDRAITRTMEVDVPMHELAERVVSSLKKYPLETVLMVIRSIGKAIETQLVQMKGVRLDKFGTFTYANSGPVFALHTDFSQQYGIRQRGVPADRDTTAMISKLNYLQVGKYAGVDREVAEKIYKSLVEALGRVALERKSTVLNLKIVDIVFVNGEVDASFDASFLSEVTAPAPDTIKMTVKAHESLRAGLDRLAISSPAETPPQPGFRRRSASANPLARPRERNPITGERDAERVREVSRRSQDRNPILHSTDDSKLPQRGSSGSRNRLLARPASSSSIDYSRNSSMANPALKKENLARLGSQPAAIAGRNTYRSATDILEVIRGKVVERGGSNGIRSLSRLLAIMDDNGDKRLSKEELMYGLRDYGISLSSGELDAVFGELDRDHNGYIDLDEFLIGIKGDMNARRKGLVKLAFRSLDKDGSGVVTIEELVDVYDFSHHPDVVAGRVTARQALKDFMKQWDGGDMDGNITYQEFEDYYKGISASIDDDDNFELMIRNAWRIAGGTGMAANTANKRVLVTNKDGSQQVVTVENELGVRPGDVDGYRKRLAQQGVDGNLELFGGLDATEKARNVRHYYCFKRALLVL